ncbi:GNAT family N-acetyltransferase [Actinophytocola sp.]|uniref:GNAT family N-acetyltransferase n=1 Tax=Actinophytocola sp. TaxID=1872138 RepID=UPI002ED7A09C
MVDRSESWTRELVELAALFLAVAVADMFANSLAHQPAGAIVLVGMGVLLIVCAVVHRWWRHRPPRVAAAGGEATGEANGEARAEVTRVWRVRATVRDTPGSLAALTASLAGHGMNILSVQVHAVPHRAVDEFLVEGHGTAAEIVAAAEAGGGRDVTVEPADPHDLVDIPTRVLTMVTQDVVAGVDLPRSMRTLLGDCELRWEATGEPSEGPDGTTLRLADPEGGLLTVSRPEPAFTPAEFARARALLDLDRVLAERIREHRTSVLLASGAELAVRQAGGADLAGIVAMHERCSDRSRRQRYLVGTARPSVADLARMVNRRNGQTLVVEHPDGDIVAMANLVWDGDTAEAALLVEDAWQRQGIGTAMLRRLTTAAATSAAGSAYAVTELTNTPMMRTLRRAGAELDRVELGLAHMTIRPR